MTFITLVAFCQYHTKDRLSTPLKIVKYLQKSLDCHLRLTYTDSVMKKERVADNSIQSGGFVQEKIRQLEKEVSLLKRCVLYLTNDLENALSEAQDEDDFSEVLEELICCFQHFHVMMNRDE